MISFIQEKKGGGDMAADNYLKKICAADLGS